MEIKDWNDIARWVMDDLGAIMWQQIIPDLPPLSSDNIIIVIEKTIVNYNLFFCDKTHDYRIRRMAVLQFTSQSAAKLAADKIEDCLRSHLCSDSLNQ